MTPRPQPSQHRHCSVGERGLKVLGSGLAITHRTHSVASLGARRSFFVCAALSYHRYRFSAIPPCTAASLTGPSLVRRRSSLGIDPPGWRKQFEFDSHRSKRIRQQVPPPRADDLRGDECRKNRLHFDVHGRGSALSSLTSSTVSPIHRRKRHTEAPPSERTVHFRRPFALPASPGFTSNPIRRPGRAARWSVGIRVIPWMRGGRKGVVRVSAAPVRVRAVAPLPSEGT